MTGGAALGLRVVLSLLAVLAVLWLLSRAMRGTRAARAGAQVEILGRQNVGRGAAVAVVRVADRALVLGITEQHVSLLGETTLAPGPGPSSPTTSRPAALLALDAAPAGGAAGPTGISSLWRGAADAMRDRTVRRR